ncbi:MAG: OB-fold nucleic acid binding domain-containing protein, partial [Rhodospirillales bacterium]
RARLSPGGIRLLAAADAFRSIGKDRRAALWDARAIREAPDLPLFTHADAEDEGEDQPVSLPEMPLSEHVVTDYQTMRFSLKAHPMAFLRKAYARREFMKTSDLPYSRFGQWVSIAGLVLVRQRPGSASGVVFITLEDESGVANLVIWPDIVERHRKIVMGARLLAAHGRIQIADNVIHLVVRNLEDETRLLDSLVDGPNQSASAEPDNIARPASPGSGRHPRSISIIPKSRDFH